MLNDFNEQIGSLDEEQLEEISEFISRYSNMNSEIIEHLFQKQYYLRYIKFFETELDKKLQDFDVELIIYDEVQFFREYYEDLFEYPFIDRKSHEATFKLSFIKSVADYSFINQKLLFHPTSVCLEEPFYVQLFFLKTLYN